MPIGMFFRGGTNAQNNTVSGTLAHNAGDFKLRATASDLSFDSGYPFSAHLLLSLEKPASFILDYDVPNKDVKFQFMNTVNLFKKRLNLTYTHVRGENKTFLDGMLVLDPSHKLSANWALASKNCKLKYSYSHKEMTAFEPCYDLASKSWDLAVSQRLLEGEFVRASYQTSSQKFGLEWSSKSMLNQGGSLKISATFNLAEGLSSPTIRAESRWNFEL